MSDDDILARLEVFLSRVPGHVLSDKPFLFESIDTHARVPRGSSARLVARILGTRWSETSRRGDVSITLHLEHQSIAEALAPRVDLYDSMDWIQGDRKRDPEFG